MSSKHSTPAHNQPTTEPSFPPNIRIHGIATLVPPPIYFSYYNGSSNSSCACPGAVCSIVPNVPNNTVYFYPQPTDAPTMPPTATGATLSPTGVSMMYMMCTCVSFS